jgi:hypothetical protein
LALLSHWQTSRSTQLEIGQSLALECSLIIGRVSLLAIPSVQMLARFAVLASESALTSGFPSRCWVLGAKMASIVLRKPTSL